MNEITDFEASAPTEAAELTIVALPGNIDPDIDREPRLRERRNVARMIGWLRRRS